MQNTWVFGYGSLIWRPGFDYIDSSKASLPGWRRVFWQGSHDHRGTPSSPGRVVTLIPDSSAVCVGRIYLVEAKIAAEIFDALDYREKNGYERVETRFHLEPGESASTQVEGVVYIANQHNEAWLGEASTLAIAEQIKTSSGPSGANIDYLHSLADALRKLDADDSHVFEIETHTRAT